MHSPSPLPLSYRYHDLFLYSCFYSITDWTHKISDSQLASTCEGECVAPDFCLGLRIRLRSLWSVARTFGLKYLLSPWLSLNIACWILQHRNLQETLKKKRGNCHTPHMCVLNATGNFHHISHLQSNKWQMGLNPPVLAWLSSPTS